MTTKLSSSRHRQQDDPLSRSLPLPSSYPHRLEEPVVKERGRKGRKERKEDELKQHINPKFHSPSWYRESPYCRSGKLCWHHEEICEPVERLLRPPPQDEAVAEELRKKKREEREERKQRSLEIEDKRMQKILSLKQTQKRRTKEERIEEEEEERLRRMRIQKDEESKELREYLRQQQLKPPTPPEWTIQEGEKYDFKHLLSSPTRDFLITNNGAQVNIEDQLSGKYVLFYFFQLSSDRKTTPACTNYCLDVDLKETYNKYHANFEVVFIALGCKEDDFRETFSNMPWLAIPHEDQEARDSFIQEFAIPPIHFARTVLFAPDGTLICEEAGSTICLFGPQCFPFTDERVSEVYEESRALWDELVVWNEKNYDNKPSLTALFGDCVVSPEGNQVPTSELEGKIVAVYFFEFSPVGVGQTRELLDIWRLLKDSGHENFEIIFVSRGAINFSFAKNIFEKEFKCAIPWYSPVVDSRQICRVFRVDSLPNDRGVFIVLKPDRYQYLNYFGFEILEDFGIEAYPFTVEAAVILAKNSQRGKLVLAELLSPSAPLHRGGSSYYKETTTTTVSKLSGKRVLLLFATHSCYGYGSFLHALKGLYLEKNGKGADDDFEIIYISLDCDESPLSSFIDSIKEMPWLVHSFVQDFGVELARKVFGVFPPQLPAIAAFGPDGYLDTKETNLAFKQDGTSEFPFIEPDLGEEVHRELIHYYQWDLERLFISAEQEEEI